MNVYLIKDGGDDRCWKGEKMSDAVQAAEDAYIAELKERREQTTSAPSRPRWSRRSATTIRIRCSTP